MRKAFIGPYYRMLIRITHKKKIIGIASKDEKEIMCNKVAKIISKIYTDVKEDEIANQIKKHLKIIYTQQLPAFEGANAMANATSIYIDKNDEDLLMSSDLKNLDYEAIRSIVHECIHKMQKGKLIHKGKSIRGFIEGATDLKAFQSTFINRSHSNSNSNKKYNFPNSAYEDLIAVMSQLEVIFGKEKMDAFAFRADTKLLDELANLIGDETYESLRHDMTAYSLQFRSHKEQLYDMTYYQDIISKTYFDKCFYNLKTQEEAEELLMQMNKMNYARIKDENGNDEFFENYFTELADKIKTKFPNISKELLTYNNPEFYPEMYYDEAVESMDNLAYSTLDTFNLEDFNKIDLSKFQRFRYSNDTNIFELITKDSKPYSFNMISSKGIKRSMHLEEHTNLMFKNNNFKLENIEGKFYFSVGQPTSLIEISNQELEEIPLNVNKKELYSRMQEYEKDVSSTDNFFVRLFRKIKGQKYLPPYEEIEKKDDDIKERKSWELSELERHAINIKSKVIAKRGLNEINYKSAHSKPSNGKGEFYD